VGDLKTISPGNRCPILSFGFHSLQINSMLQFRPSRTPKINTIYQINSIVIYKID